MKKKNKNGLNISIPRLLISLGVFSFVVYGVVTLVTQQVSIVKCHELITTYNQELGRQQQIATELDRLSEEANSQQYIEKMARDKLGLVKGNEKIFIDGAGR